MQIWDGSQSLEGLEMLGYEKKVALSLVLVIFLLQAIGT